MPSGGWKVHIHNTSRMSNQVKTWSTWTGLQEISCCTGDAPIQSKPCLVHINTPGDPFTTTLQPSRYDPLVIDGTTRPGATNHFALYEMDVQVNPGLQKDVPPNSWRRPLLDAFLVSGRRSIYYRRHSSLQGHFQSTLNHLVLLEAFVPREIR